MRICGLDEAGRGALAGPLVAAATIINDQFPIAQLKDSKKLSVRQRNKLFKLILKKSEVVEVEVITARQINNRGMGWANKEIFKRLIKKTEADRYIVDGNLKIRVRGKSQGIRSMVDADTKIPEVMAASIVAKVTRDRLMRELAKEHPRYGWQTNAGYGTAYHLAAIGTHGTIHYHRSVFVTTALRSKMV